MSNGRLATATGAVLCFFATYGAGYLSFSGDQLWIFQRLMGFVALGLFLIFAVGISVGDWTLER